MCTLKNSKNIPNAEPQQRNKEKKKRLTTETETEHHYWFDYFLRRPQNSTVSYKLLDFVKYTGAESVVEVVYNLLMSASKCASTIWLIHASTFYNVRLISSVLLICSDGELYSSDCIAKTKAVLFYHIFYSVTFDEIVIIRFELVACRDLENFLPSMQMVLYSRIRENAKA